MHSISKKRKLNTVLYHIFVCFFGFVMIYPLLWLLASSFKLNENIFSDALNLIPVPATLQNYANGWKGFAGVGFSNFFKNSFIISILATVGASLSSAVIAYGFARGRFKLKKLLFVCMMVTMMLPYQVIMVPQFIIFQRLGWVGGFLPLIVPYFFGQGFFIFLIMQFIQGIPRDLDEAARIDGCTMYGIFSRIILPLIVPAIVTCVVFSFMWRWDDFLASLIYLNNPVKYTVSLALRMFSDPSSLSDWGSMFAMSILSLVPIFVIFVTCQKYLVEGISTSGLKG